MMQNKVKVIDNWGGGLVDADILRPADNQLTEVDGLDPSSGKLRVMKADTRLLVNDTYPSSVDGADIFTNVDEYTNSAGELYYVGKRGNTVWFAKPGELVEVPPANSYPQRESAGIFQLNYAGGSTHSNTGTMGTLTKVGSPVVPGTSGGNWTTVGTIGGVPGYFEITNNSGWWTGKTGFVPFTISAWIRVPLSSVPTDGSDTVVTLFQCPYAKIDITIHSELSAPGMVIPGGCGWSINCYPMLNSDSITPYTAVYGCGTGFAANILQCDLWYNLVFAFGDTATDPQYILGTDGWVRQRGLGLRDYPYLTIWPQVTLGQLGTYNNIPTATSPINTYLGDKDGGPQINIGYFTLLSTYVAIR